MQLSVGEIVLSFFALLFLLLRLLLAFTAARRRLVLLALVLLVFLVLLVPQVLLVLRVQRLPLGLLCKSEPLRGTRLTCNLGHFALRISGQC